jgi:hypothetical protein
LSILSTACAPEAKPPRIVIHGKPGVGKTRFAASVPDVLFIPAEEGLVNLPVMAVPRPRTFPEVMQVLRELCTEEHGYKAVAIDAIDHIEPLIWQYTCETESAKGKADFSSIESFGYGKGYLYAESVWISFFRALDAVRAKGLTVVILSHSAVTPVTDPIIGPYDVVAPKLHKRANDLLYGWSDILGYLDLERISVEKDGARGRKMGTSKVLQGQRVLYVEDTGGFTAKNRYDLAPRFLIDKADPYKALGQAIDEANQQASAGAVKKESK